MNIILQPFFRSLIIKKRITGCLNKSTGSHDREERNSISATVRHTVISKNVLTIQAGENMVEASTTKVSSKGQVVIPANVRKAASLEKGEKILAIAIDETVILKKIVDKSFEETMKPVWDRVRQMGLTEEDINALIEEARAQDSS